MTPVAETAAAETSHDGHWRANRHYAELFVGLAWPQYSAVYDGLSEGRSTLVWSWAAFFFPWPWLIYRKLYIWAAAVWVLDTLGYVMLDHEDASFYILVIHVLVGIFGSTIFIRQVNARIRDATAKYPKEDDRIRAVTDAGNAKGCILLVAIPSLIALQMAILYQARG